MSLLIYNVVIFTNDEQNAILTEHAVLVNGTKISSVGPADNLKAENPDAHKIDGGGRLLMPGLINTHMHFYGTYARGLALSKAPQNFYEILSELWWKLDFALDLKAVYYSALVPAITAIKNGVTSVVDHHASPNAIEGSLDKIEEALDLLGMRATLCYEVSDRDGREACEKGLEENARYIQKCRIAKNLNEDHLFDAMVGLHASFTLKDISLKKAAELRWTTDRGCHIHLLEDELDRRLTRQKYETNVVERLAEFGILGEKTIAAHGIYLDEHGIDLITATDSMIVHNPQSNMNNAVGRADVFTLVDKNVLIGLGTDGMSPDVRPDARTANLLHKHHLEDSNVGWHEIQTMLLMNNPKIYQRISDQKVGKIVPGYLADIILVDYCAPTPINSDNFWGHFLFGIADAIVDTTIINGRLIMVHKEIAGLDEESISAHSRECAEKVWRRFAEA